MREGEGRSVCGAPLGFEEHRYSWGDALEHIYATPPRMDSSGFALTAVPGCHGRLDDLVRIGRLPRGRQQLKQAFDSRIDLAFPDDSDIPAQRGELFQV